MSEWLFVVLMIVAGITLLVLEIIFLPGGIVGVIGVIMLLMGDILAFAYFGTQVGILVSILMLVFVGGAFGYAFRTRAWERFSLKQRHTAQVRKPCRHKGFVWACGGRLGLRCGLWEKVYLQEK